MFIKTKKAKTHLLNPTTNQPTDQPIIALNFLCKLFAQLYGIKYSYQIRILFGYIYLT